MADIKLFMNKDYWELESTANFFRDKEADVLVEKAVSEVKSDGKKALDIGCGGGRNSLVLAKKGFQVNILDNYQIMLDTTVNLLNTNGFSVSSSGLQDVSMLDIGECNFDIILCIGVLHQNNSTSSLLESIERIYKSLKVGGVFVYNVFTSDHIDSALTPLDMDRFQTNENAPMLLVPKDKYLRTFQDLGFKELYSQYDVKDVNTGKRSILRGIMMR